MGLGRLFQKLRDAIKYSVACSLRVLALECQHHLFEFDNLGDVRRVAAKPVSDRSDNPFAVRAQPSPSSARI